MPGYKFKAYTWQGDLLWQSLKQDASEVSFSAGNYGASSTAGPSTVKMRWIGLSPTTGATKILLHLSLHTSTFPPYTLYLQRHTLLCLWLELHICEIADERFGAIVYGFFLRNKKYLMCGFFLLSFPFWLCNKLNYSITSLLCLPKGYDVCRWLSS